MKMFRHFETTVPTVAACNTCRRPTLYGLAEGIPARVDITPISPASEAAHIADGRVTYTLRRDGLIQRDEHRRTDPKLASPILAAHRCPQARPQASSQQLELDFRRTA